MVIQPKKLGSNKKEILLSGDTSTSPQLYNKLTITLVDDVADENFELAQVYLEDSAEYNYYVYNYTPPFSPNNDNELLSLIESGLIQVGNTQPSPTIITPEQTKNNIVL